MLTRLATTAVVLALTACAATWAEAQPAASPPKSTSVNIASESAAAEERLRAAVRRTVAAYFGVKIEDVTDSTDLLRDLHADAMEAYEVLVIVCREQGVAAPTRDDLITVGAIVAYLKTAPRSQPAVAQRGWATRPGAAATAPDKVIARTLFYATDRAPANGLLPEQYFGAERQAGNRLNYGTCEVTIPAAHRAGQTEEPAWYRLEWEGDPAKHFMLKSVQPLERAAFFAEVRSRFQGKPAETFVFVHGYNVSFSRAARRTAQIAYDLDFQGVPILFSWPSAARLTAYFSDRENAEWSAAHLARFLEELIAETPRGRLHLLAHSMGNQTLIRALADIAARRESAGAPLFENVVLAAPDFDAQLFLEQIAPRVVALARHWTLYASDKDRALDAATTLSARRLGLPLPITRGIDTVDASGIDVAPWSVPEFHTYFASKQRVISDLVQVLRGTPPNERKLQSRSRDGLPYWTLAPL
jgi:esterase/lipase superfamily enzyme/acyl carrier protein